MQHNRLPAALLITAGLSLAAYPAARPWSDAVRDIGSGPWVLSHGLGMLGFTLTALALRAMACDPRPWWSGQPARRAETRMWLALALLLPYYGAETFALHAAALGGSGALESALKFRNAGLPTTTFGLGLLLLALVGTRLIIGLWQTGTMGRLGGLLAGTGLLTYLPQFFVPMPLRIAHGAFLGAGLVMAGIALTNTTNDGDSRRTRESGWQQDYAPGSSPMKSTR